MRNIGKIAVSKAVFSMDKPYSYLIPTPLLSKIQVGTRVLVPFGGGNRGSEGIVLAITQEDTALRMKEILALLDDTPVLDDQGIQLALWLRERYFCTVYDGVKAMLPAGLYFSLRDCLVMQEGLSRDAGYTLVEDSAPARELLELLFIWNGQGEMEQIRLAFGSRDPNPAIKILVDRGLCRLETSTQRGVGEKHEKIAVLAIPGEEAMTRVTPKRSSAPLRFAVTELLCAMGSASVKELCYFTGASGSTIKSLERSGILTIQSKEVFRSPHPEDVIPAPPVVLSPEQEVAFQGIDALCQAGTTAAALLYGVTGSGKTNVYIRLIRETLSRGKTAMVLVPEISLTPQLLRIFIAHFGTSIAVLHSSLRAGERYDEWRRVKNGEATVVIGTRSAVFAPLKNIGLIVLDEEQEASYKSESTPRYHAREVAKYRCVQSKGLLLLGSATPSIESMYHAKSGKYHLFTLKTRYNQQNMPQVHIQDMKESLRLGQGSVLSGALCEQITRNLQRDEQTILFLNRRGASRMASCVECGEVPECPRCSVKLTYHSANGRLMCHYCGHSQPSTQICPSCGGTLDFVGMGTQRVEEALAEKFPQTPVLRMDADTVHAKQSHQKILDQFQKKRIPILLGTQMVAKGLDFDNVTLVGVLDPDLALYTSDIRAAERTFSLITQVVGRAGRGQRQGRAVIQTYTPENEVITLAASQDYDSFYEGEIALRGLRNLPPFTDVFLLCATGPTEATVLRAMNKLVQGLNFGLQSIRASGQILGPAPAPIAKINGKYRYRITLHAKNTRALRGLIAHLIRSAQQDKENKTLTIYGDFNPLDG